MTTAQLADRTRVRLAARPRRIVLPGPLVRAAVLVPIVDRGEPVLVFAKRTEQVGQHAGQISFPGGRAAPTDPSLLATALRECHEEIGLAPGAVEPLGALDDTETFATQYVITPYVGLVHDPGVWRPDGAEIASVIEVPFRLLAAPDAHRVEYWERNGVTRPVYFFDYQGESVWGATARILKSYLDLVTDGGETPV